jgi:hypothetical protein
VGFVVDTGTGTYFLQVLLFSSANIFPPWPSMVIYPLGDEQGLLVAAVQRHSLTPIDMNNNMNKVIELML